MKKAKPVIVCVIAFVFCFILYSLYLYQEQACGLSAGTIGKNEMKGVSRLVTPVVEYKGKKYRRNTYLIAILLIGVDTSGPMTETKTSGFGGQADGIFLIAEDTARDNIKILMIPRDTMAEITLTDLEGNVIGKDLQHITLAYAYGDGKEKSCAYIKEAVSGLLGGLQIDYYLAVNTSAISVMNDKIGGVPVLVDTKDLEQKDPSLKKGETVVLNGKQAEEFLRYRDVTVTNSALTRMERQKQYMKSYIRQLKKECRQNNQLMIQMVHNMQDYLLTDMDEVQYKKMAADFLAGGQLLTDQDIYVAPGTGVATELYDEYHIDPDALMEMILNLFYRQVE